MKIRIIKLMAIGLITVLMAVTAVAQQDVEVAEVSSGNFFGIGARGLGMGGAQVAAGLDGTAIVYNPAVLARIRRIEVLAGMSHQKLSNDENRSASSSDINTALDGRSKSFTRLNALNVTVPVPTYRGSAVVAFGINRVSSFDHVFQYARTLPDGGEVGTEIETGGLYQYSAAGAIDISPKISVGASLNLYHGKDDYTWTYSHSGSQQEDYTQYVNADYTGVSAKLGLIASVNRNISIGAVVETPVQYEIDGEFSEELWAYPNAYEYELEHPFVFGGGMSARYGRLQAALDLHYTDWTQMEYKEYDLYTLENGLIDRYYREVVRINAGVEYLIPRFGAKVRAGYIYDPLPYADFLVENDRDFVTLGVGFLIDRVMTLDIAFVTGSYEYAKPAPDANGAFDISSALYEKYSIDRLYVTTAFRL